MYNKPRNNNTQKPKIQQNSEVGKEQVLANEAPRVAKSRIQDGSQNLLYRRHEKSYIWDVAPENEMRNAKYLQIAHKKRALGSCLLDSTNIYIIRKHTDNPKLPKLGRPKLNKRK